MSHVRSHAGGPPRLGRAAEVRLSGALLITAAAACWVVTANRMQGMDMGPGTELGGLGWFVGVWATMMAAMMLPSLAPMGAAYARADAGRGSAEGQPFVATVAFATG